MKKLFLLATIAITAITNACSTTSITNKKYSTSANKKTVKAALKGTFVVHYARFINKHFAAPYIQHNPLAPYGFSA